MSTIRGDVVTGLRPPQPTLIKALIFRHPPTTKEAAEIIFIWL